MSNVEKPAFECHSNNVPPASSDVRISRIVRRHQTKMLFATNAQYRFVIAQDFRAA